MFPFLPLFHKNVRFGLKEMRAEQVRHVVRAGMGISLYSQKDECMYHMFCPVLTYCKVSIGYLKGASDIHKMLEAQSPRSPMEKAMSQPSAFEMQAYFRAFMIL